MQSNINSMGCETEPSEGCKSKWASTYLRSLDGADFASNSAKICRWAIVLTPPDSTSSGKIQSATSVE